MNCERERLRVLLCIPVMDRVEDLRATLGANLEVVRRFGGSVAIAVIVFDEAPTKTLDVLEAFAADVEVGVLHYVTDDRLQRWHFSRAKNSFADRFDHLSPEYYSSLDGDNFVSEQELVALLRLLDRGGSHVIHHFSGTWGDGTSGRVTLPWSHYRHAPYLEATLPRQFDEMGAILRCLVLDPDLIFVARPGVDIFEASMYLRRFLAESGLRFPRMSWDLGAVVPPANPRGQNYVEEDLRLRDAQALNAWFTCWQLACELGGPSERFKDELVNAQHAVAGSGRLETTSGVVRQEAGPEPVRSDAVTLYSVVKEDGWLQRAWLDHYRSLGIERFIVVDDRSPSSIWRDLDAPDVHVFSPEFGAFQTSKTFWLAALLAQFQNPGSWVVTVDVDEFVDLPEVHGSTTAIRSWIGRLEAQGTTYGLGVLVDLLPADDIPAEQPFWERYILYQFREVGRTHAYALHHAVRWGFGELWNASFALDVRYRYFGTIDSLRKVPVWQYQPQRQLNQGFHDVTVGGISDLGPPEEAVQRGLVPVRHYKLVKFFEQADPAATIVRDRESYAARTQSNLTRASLLDPQFVRRSVAVSPWVRRYEGAEGFPFTSGVTDREPPLAVN